MTFEALLRDEATYPKCPICGRPLDCDIINDVSHTDLFGRSCDNCCYDGQDHRCPDRRDPADETVCRCNFIGEIVRLQDELLQTKMELAQMESSRRFLSKQNSAYWEKIVKMRGIINDLTN